MRWAKSPAPYTWQASYGKTYFARPSAVPSTADTLDGPTSVGGQVEVARGSPAGWTDNRTRWATTAYGRARP